MKENIKGVLHKKNISLKKFNNFRINAKALNFYIPETINGFIDLIKYFEENKKKYFVLGGGSNILFLDEIVETPIIFTGFFSRIENYSDGILGYSGAKVVDLVKCAYKNSFGGLEFLFGLPGTIGGAAYMNARCYEHSISEFIESVGIIDENFEYNHIETKDCDYDYKKSVFQNPKLRLPPPRLRSQAPYFPKHSTLSACLRQSKVHYASRNNSPAKNEHI